ncbi:glutathione S-transferase [Pelagivirga sediminicola]|uniref:Glutathione S-transferase n=1 Tax=Pelagivirga sediminicola TaxID=2170575 RepID=A0A2T7G9A3_9RHOB|nr:glutathione S-transferase family protein [Pelagivirga sediminicola]PVA10993.1 glutathione S-transferase [Pelagivirga sediminicola]
MTLIFHYAPDNASLIVRLALEELGLPYTTRLVDRAQRQQEGPAYRALNPHGLIPTLETPDGALFETGAILLWLADRHPGTLAPMPDAQGRGTFLKWLMFTSNTLHPALRMTFYPEKYCPGHGAALRRHMRGEITRHLASLDGAVAGPWFMGGDIGAIDLYLGPLLRWCALYPLGETAWFDLAQTPALARICAGLEGRACTARARTAEGLGDTPFTAPRLPEPPEGSAT